MKLKIGFWLVILCLGPVFGLKSQDVYYVQLMNDLIADYQLPKGDWLSFDTELANINAGNYYGDIVVNTADVGDQAFSKRVRIEVNSGGGEAWSSAWTFPNPKTISKGHRLLWVVWLRSVGGNGKINLFAEDAITYTKEAIYTLPIVEQWTQYMIPFEASDAYSVSDLNFGFHLGLQTQTIEFGGFAIIDFGTSVPLDQLPDRVNNEFYGGYEEDAPWRAEANARIDQFRKANLSIQLKNEDGTPIPNVGVEVKMIRHEYAFGTAVVACRFAGNNCQNNLYESKLLDLDGKGHGFNEVVFENALKWPGWENAWIASKPETAKAVQWLVDRGISVRGHNLVWPGENHLPNDINANLSNLNYVKNRIDQHLEEILTYPGIKQNIKDWDVLNEITFNRTLEEAFRAKLNYISGRELYAEIFTKAKAVAPEAIMYLNDYITISQDRSSGEIYDRYQSFIQELLDAGAPLEGIGFQAHIGGFPVSIYSVYDILEDFHLKFGLESKVTEFDLSDQVNDELAAKYLRDFMTINFSHPSSKGFLMWGFWDGNHWLGNAPLYNLDWSIKPAGQAFIDLVFDEWWTDKSLTSNQNGEIEVRGFKGTYEIVYAHNGVLQRDTFILSEDMQLEIIANQSTGIFALEEKLGIRVFPNPAQDYLFIDRTDTKPAILQIFDLPGRLIKTVPIQGQQVEIPLQLSTGLYQLLWREDGEVYYHKLIIE